MRMMRMNIIMKMRKKNKNDPHDLLEEKLTLGNQLEYFTNVVMSYIRNTYIIPIPLESRLRENSLLRRVICLMPPQF